MSPAPGGALETAPAPGTALDAVETPALVLDLDALERNVAAMAAAAARAGVALRPHAKTHKCPEIARMQVAAGAVGVACQTVGEAEAMVAGGVADVLVTNEVVSRAKLARLCALAARARVGVCVDEASAAEALSALAVERSVEIDVLVEIDVGQGRCGTEPGAPAARLAARVAGLAGLRFAGLQAYNGTAQHFRTPAERAGAVTEAARLTRSTLDALAAEGLSARVVGGAGTGTWPHEAASGIWTEIQPGSYAVMDADYAENAPDPGAPRFEQALWVLGGVISRRTDLGRVVLDAGHKAVAIDSGPPRIAGGRVVSMSDEHAVLAMAPDAVPALGARLRLVPGHCDPTINLHDRMIGVRGLDGPAPSVERVLAVTARGAFA